jgi:hypothetical protein
MEKEATGFGTGTMVREAMAGEAFSEGYSDGEG